MKNNLFSYFLNISIASSVVLLASCSNTKYLKDGEMLYTGTKVEVVSDSLSKKEKKSLAADLKDQLSPKPNSSILGLRPKLFFYNIAGEPKKDKGFKHWLKNKMGEKPVLLGNVDKEFNKKIIENYSENKGYFNAKASYDTVSKNKKAQILYTVKPGFRYTIKSVEFPKDSSIVNAEIQAVKDKTLLKPGQPFDLDVIKAERVRIDNRMKEKGFYYFHPDNIIVQADSTINKKHEVEMFVKMKPNTPPISKEQFTINKVLVFPDYNIQDVRKGRYSVPMNTDSIQPYNNKYVIDPDKKFNPRVFDRALYFESGDLYNRTDHNLSLNRLISLGVFKFVKNEFVVSDSLNHKFDVYYLLTPREFQSLRLEALGKTNSANYAGSELNLSWTHRNIFKGAEQLKVTAFGGFDVQMGGSKDGGNLFRAGLKSELSIPRIVAPFRFNSSSAFVPRTVASIGYEYQNRTKLYTLHNFNLDFGYNWKENVRKEHELKVLNFALVFPENITQAYKDLIYDVNGNVINSSLKRVVDKQFILGSTYSYTYTNTMLPIKNTIYYKGTVDLAGNIVGLLTGANAKKDKEKEIFKIPFSQFAKMEHDFRFYHKFTEKSMLATRFAGGIAYPYGNSMFVPFSRQFFSGGSNSIRAFRARTLGPGSFDPRTIQSNYYLDQSGDIKLELNAEYRANVYKFLNVAAFADAGNIWLVNKDESRPGGEFTSKFLNEIAVGAGVGLRLDFSILILRLDLAMPLRVPYFEEGDRWTFDKINFGDKSWRRDNLMLNIAIGYPF